MTSMREHGRDDREDQEVAIELQELVLVRSSKTYDLYRVACRLKQAGHVVNLQLG